MHKDRTLEVGCCQIVPNCQHEHIDNFTRVCAEQVSTENTVCAFLNEYLEARKLLIGAPR